MTADRLRFDTVVFDVGGTLLGFHDWVPFQEILAEAGMPSTEKDAVELHDRFRRVLAARRNSGQGLGADESELDRWWQSVFRDVWPDRPSLADAMFRAFRADRFDRVFGDVVPALEALRGLGLRLGLLSNFTSDLENLLQRLGLRDYFSFVIVSALVGVAKPERAIFDRAVAAAGSSRDRLLYVGDHIGDDIEGARGAGLSAVLIDRGARFADAPCPRIGSLLELPTYVRFPARPSQGILFDLDGVVLDSTAAHLRAWQETLAPLGISMGTDDLRPLEGMPTEPMARELIGRLSARQCTPEEARQLALTKRALFLKYLEPRPIPGSVSLLHNLHGRGYRLGLVTGNAGAVVAGLLQALGVARLFDVLVTADEVAHGKPDPEPYRLAAERLGLLPSHCLAVENAPLGVQSAKAAGMKCVAVETTLPGRSLGPADAVFPDVSALSAWLLAQWASEPSRHAPE